MKNEYYTNLIFQKFNEPFILNKIEHHYRSDGAEMSYYVITFLRKKNNVTPLDYRCEKFYAFIHSIFKSSDVLNTDNECFTVLGDGFSVSFYIEGFKNANQKAYFDNETNCINCQPINRMGVHTAFKYCRKYNISIDSIRANMSDLKNINNYPNPCDRFICLVKIHIINNVDML